MNFPRSFTRLTTIALLASAATVTLAPLAEAHGWSRARYRGGYYGGGSHVVVRERVHDGGGAGSFFVGLIGGAILGSALSHPQPQRQVVVHEHVYRSAPPAPSCDDDQSYRRPPTYRDDDRYNDRNDDRYDSRDLRQGWMDAPQGEYRFEDTSGERWWDTFDEATDAARGNRGPRAIRIIDADSNQVVKTLTWDRGRWIDEQGRALDDRDDD